MTRETYAFGTANGSLMEVEAVNETENGFDR
jgi:hypothetical protein